MLVYILSRQANLYSTHRLSLSAQSRGHEVRIVDYTRCQPLLLGGVPTVLYEGKPLARPDGIVPRIAAPNTREGAALIRHFEAMGVPTTLGSDALLRTRDKFTSLQLLAAAELPTPNTLSLQSPDELDTVLELLQGPPVILKIPEGTHGAGVILAETRASAVSTIETLTRSRQPLLVQEYIPEARGTDLRLLVVDGTVVAGMERRAAGSEFRANLHRGGTGTNARLSFAELRIAKRACRVLHLDVAGVDLLRSERGPLLIEVNASPGLEGIEGATKVNVARKIVNCLEHKMRADRDL